MYFLLTRRSPYILPICRPRLFVHLDCTQPLYNLKWWNLLTYYINRFTIKIQHNSVDADYFDNNCQNTILFVSPQDLSQGCRVQLHVVTLILLNNRIRYNLE